MTSWFGKRTGYRRAPLAGVEQSEGSCGLAKLLTGSGWGRVQPEPLCSSLVEATHGTSARWSPVSWISRVFFADDSSSVEVALAPIELGVAARVSVDREVGEIVVLELAGCPSSFSGPITLVSRTVGLVGSFGGADGPPRGVPLDRAMLLLRAR